MVDVTDEKELEAWLDKQPHQVKIVFANRAALRLIPFVLDRLVSDPESGATTKVDFSLFCFRGSLISGVASTWPTPKISDELTAAATLAARAATRAARATTLATLDATLDATRATTRATLATLENDVEFVESGAGPRTLHQQPLWSGTNFPDELAERWQSFRDTFGNTEWAFWIEWYQAVLDGRPLDWDLQRKIALIPDEDWEKGVAHIAQKIEIIRAQFELNKKLDAAEEKIAQLEASRRSIGGNHPPEPIDDAAFTVALSAVRKPLEDLREEAEAETETPDTSRILAALEKLRGFLIWAGNPLLLGAKTALLYAGKTADTFVQEFVKSAGGALGKAAAATGVGLLAGEVAGVIDAGEVLSLALKTLGL